ncbi:SdrD B-like domain-containing protein [Nevskia sp.]|uniref:DUF7933 domain-containing protein n=1 Tax=Nevskia sp. TaxID=1929292 RepID=UPI0025FBE013|nr:SdrD B-like domain-containing protein [Nevskia sp.]
MTSIHATRRIARNSVALRLRKLAGLCALALGLGGFALPANATLDVNKSFQPININPGQTSVLQVDLFNNENVALTATQFTDLLPAGITIVALPAPTTTCGGIVTAPAGGTSFSLANGTVPAGNGVISGTCNVRLTVTGSLSGTFVNTIPVGGATGDSGPNGGLGPQSNQQPASATLTISPYVPLTGNKTFPNADPDFVKGGGAVPFSITLNNPNLSPVTGVAFVDNFPARLLANGVVVSNTCGGTLTDAAGSAINDGDTGIRLTGGTIAANGSCTITAQVRPAAPNDAYNDVQTNTIATGAVTSVQGASNSAPLSASIVVQTGGSIVKSFDLPAVLSDGAEASTLTLRLRNFNVTAINGASLTDALPAGVTVAAVPNITATNCGAPAITAAPGATSINIAGATIPAAANAIDAAGECVVTVDVVTTVNGNATNTIPDGSYGAGLPSYTGTSAALFGNNFAVSADKAFSPNVVQRGGTTTLTITLSNASTLPATITSFTDDLATAGAGVVIAPTPAASTTCVGGTVSAPAGGTLITQNNGVIPAGGSCTITVPVSVQNTAAFGTHTNVILPNGLVTDRGTNNGAAFADFVIPADVSGNKSFSPTSVVIGSTTTLTITLNNTTAAPATISSFTDSLITMDPNGNVVVAAAPAATTTCGGTVTAVPGSTQITKTDGAIPANGSCTITVPITPRNGAPLAVVQNVVEIGGLVTSVGSNDDIFQAQLTINPAITGAKAFSPATVARGQSSTLTITLNNASTAPATSLALTDNLATLDAGGAFTISATPAASTTCGGTLTAAPGATTISLASGTIPATGACVITVPVTPGPTAIAGLRTNTIPAGAVQTSLGDNQTPITADITVNPAASINKTLLPATVGIGQVSRLTITINRDPGAPAFTGVALSDDLTTLGPGHSIANPANLTNTCGGTVSAVVGGTSISLAGGSLSGATTSCSFAVNVQTPNTVGSGTNTIPAGALVTAGGFSNDVSATATLNRIDAITDLTLNKAFNPTSVSGNTFSVLSILINNSQSGAVNLSNVTLTDNLPNGMIVFATPNASFTGPGCANATITAVPGSSTVVLSGATIDAGTVCTLAVNTTAVVDGNLTNSIPVGAVTSTQGITNSNSPSATLTVQRNISVQKAFTPTTIVAGDVSTLSLLFVNAEPVSRTNGALIDNFPPGLIVAGPATANTCLNSTLADGAGGPLVAGATSIRVTGITFPPNSSCQIDVPVTSATPGVYVNTIPANALTTTEGSTNNAPTTGTLTNLAAPTIVKSFTPDTIPVNGTSTISFLLSNPNDGTLLPGGFTGASFTDTLTGISIAATGSAGGTCVGAAGNTFTAGQTALSFTGLSIPVSGSCTVTVVVTAAAAGTYPNTTSGVVTAQTPTSPGNPSNTVNLLVLAPPQIAKAFSPAAITAGGTSRLTLTLTNPNATVLTISNPGLIDTFPIVPGAMTVATVPNLATTCVGATVNDSANGALNGGDVGIRVNGGSIPANGACTVSIDVTATVTGSYVNTTGLLNTDNAGSSVAGGTDTLTVNAPVGVSLSGFVYRDANTNGTLDGAEDWSLGAPVFVNVVQNGVVLYSQAVPAGGGAYNFPNVPSGTYSVIVSDSAVSLTPAAPDTFRFVFPNDGTQLVTVATTPVSLVNFGLIDGGLVSGRVFRDSGPTANDGIQQSPVAEPGLSGVTVRLTDCAGTTFGTTTTNGNGDYFLPVPSTVANGATVCVEETNPPGYLSTGANVAGTSTPDGASTTIGGTTYTYTRQTPSERTQFVYSTTVRNYPNLNFGEVLPPVFTTDNTQTALPGTTVDHPHTFTAQTGGSVVFSTSAVPRPQVPDWSEVLYLDSNCSGAIDSGELPITGPLTLVAGQQICIVNREFVPAAAPVDASNVVTVTATFTYANATPGLTTVLTHTDTTIVGDGTGAALNLVKTVSTGTTTPGSILTYTITYSNRSSQPLSTIVINDAVPPFTSFVSAAAGPLPASLTACSKTTPSGGPVDCAAVQAPAARGALRWTFTGILQPGSSGTVTFQVQVDP